MNSVRVIDDVSTPIIVQTIKEGQFGFFEPTKHMDRRRAMIIGLQDGHLNVTIGHVRLLRKLYRKWTGSPLE
jgi:hypothetical protein